MQMANAEKRQIEPKNRNANKAGDKIQDNICMLLSLRKQAAASVDIYSNGMTVNRTGQPPKQTDLLPHMYSCCSEEPLEPHVLLYMCDWAFFTK